MINSNKHPNLKLFTKFDRLNLLNSQNNYDANTLKGIPS